jgi:hypothetical protein
MYARDPWEDEELFPETKSARGAGHRLAVVVMLVVVVGPVVAVFVAEANHARYGVLAPWSTPSRISYCGRYYQAENVVQGTPAALLAEVTGRPRWTEVSRTMWLTPVYAAVSQHHGDLCAFAMVLYIPTGTQRYLSYDLEGGP